MKRTVLAGFAAILFCLACPVFAQTTGNIQGKVVDEQGEPLPGVVVSAESPNMIGSRSDVSRANGEFLFRGLPPGEYSITATMTGMRTKKVNIALGLAQTSRPTLIMAPETTSEELVVTASVDPVLDTTSVTTHFEKDFIDKLASNRDQRSVALLSPGVTSTAFGGRIQISGSPSHANMYVVNGADARFDNLRGTPANTVIEDAIQETTIMNGAISAEYGNFSGGVVSTITKSGGNEFSGSFRTRFTNNDWIARRPIELQNAVERVDDIEQEYQVTVGGPIIKDRVWFFVAGKQFEDNLTSNFLAGSPMPDSVAIAYGLEPGQTAPGVAPIPGRLDEDFNYEVKFTARIADGHDLVASFQDSETQNFNRGTGFEESALQPERTITGDALALNYRGQINPNLSIELMYTERESVFEERPTGFIAGDQRITGTLLRDRRTFGQFNSSQFLGKPDEPRGNDTYRAKINYFWITDTMGSHDIVAGFEDFTDYRRADNRQSLNDWQFWSDVRFEPGSRQPIPIYSPTSANGRYQSRLIYRPIENPSLTSDLNAQSVFINDSWTLNNNWRFNLGLRYDDRFSRAEDGSIVADDSKLAPRLSAIYDLRGDGKHEFSASYSEYVQRTGQGSQDGSQAGSPSFAWLNYTGPQTEDYLEVINWINETYGPDFFFDPLGSPNVNQWRDDLVNDSLFDPAGASQIIGVPDAVNGGVIPTPIDSPSVQEIRLGYQTRFDRGYFKADFITRDFVDFYIDYTNLVTGRTANGRGDLNAINNNDDDYEKNYHSVQLQGGYQVAENLRLNGNYTWAQSYGNIEGQSGSGVSSTAGATTIYPEFNNFDNRNPVGYLSGDQRHIANIFAVYDVPTQFGIFNFSVTQRFQSGTPFNEIVSLSLTGGRDVQYGFIPRSGSGYRSPPTTTSYYLSPRGSLRAEDMTQTNLGINWELALNKVDLFVQFDIFNIFNEDNAFNGAGYNTSVTRGETFNVFTDQPVRDVNYTRGSLFGTPTSNAAYQTPRTFRFDVGFKF